jgi:hypothetical protein
VLARYSTDQGCSLQDTRWRCWWCSWMDWLYIYIVVRREQCCISWE